MGYCTFYHEGYSSLYEFLSIVYVIFRTAEPLSIAIFLDDIRQYSLINRPSRKLLAVQTSDYDTASIDSSTNSVTRTFSELSMGYAGSLQR